MENEIIGHLETLLKANTAFTNVMGVGDACRLYAGIAPESATVPFVAYLVDEADTVSKDGAGDYRTTVVLVYGPDKYRACLEMKNIVKTTLANDGFMYRGVTTAYSEEMDKYVSIIEFSSTNA